MLPLHRQEHYRRRYHRLHPAWQPATAVYERLVHQHLARTSARVQHPLTVLDVGCGAGGVLERLAPQVGRPYGLDRDLASLQRHRAPIALLAGDMAALPFAAASVDLLLSAWVFEHLADPVAAVAELARVLKPQGQLIFLTPNAEHWLVRLNRWVPTKAQARLVRAMYARAAGDTFPVQYALNTLTTITAVAGAAGLEPVTLLRIRDPTYVAVNEAGFWLGMLLDGLLAAHTGVHLVGALIKPCS